MAPLIALANKAFAPEAQECLKLPVMKLLDSESCDRILVTAVCPIKDVRPSPVMESKPCAPRRPMSQHSHCRAHLTDKETRLGEEKWAGWEAGGYTTHSQPERRAGET